MLPTLMYPQRIGVFVLKPPGQVHVRKPDILPISGLFDLTDVNKHHVVRSYVT